MAFVCIPRLTSAGLFAVTSHQMRKSGSPPDKNTAHVVTSGENCPSTCELPSKHGLVKRLYIHVFGVEASGFFADPPPRCGMWQRYAHVVTHCIRDSN